MATIFIEHVLLNEETTNILIDNKRIAGIGSELPMPAGAFRIDGNGKAVLPTFANMHTHAAMSLLKGCGSDTPLATWLNDWIWPRERHIDDNAVYWGTRLACAEMIQSGTTAFSDMYFHIPAAARAVADAGIRCTLGINIFGDAYELTDALIEDTLAQLEPYGDRVKLSIAPHSVYTVSVRGLEHAARMAHKYGLLYHIHMNETESEINDCLAKHGCRPYQLLERIGVMELLSGHIAGAHSLHLDDDEIALLGKYRTTVVHNPSSNLKLGSGYRFRYRELRDAGVRVTLGTDGSASSNHLDMIESARLMSYLQKGINQDPTLLPVEELMLVAGRNGFDTLAIDAGKIEVGRLADLMLVDLDNLAFVPNHDTLSSLFFAAHGDAVDTVLCDGKPVMLHREIDGLDDIRHEARRAAAKLL